MKSAVLLAGLGASGPTTVDRARADARPHRADAARRRRRASRRRPSSVSVEPAGAAAASARSTSPATSRRRRRSSSRRRCSPGRGSRSTTSASTRAAPGLLDVLERMGARVGDPQRAARSAASRSATSRCGSAELDRDDDRRATRCRCSSTSCRSSRCSPRTRAATSWVNGAEELRAEGDRPDRGASSTRCARSACARRRTPDGFSVSGVPTRPRGGTVDARGDHRIAMLGAVAGLVSREGVEIEGAESVGDKLPRLLRPPRVR